MDLLFAWNDSFCTGIRAIDKQHKVLVHLVNQLNFAIKANNKDSISEILTGFIDFTESHFSFEENLQKQHKYPVSNAYKQKHDDFLKRISQYKDRHDDGEDVAKKLSSELILWLTSHIKTDKEDMPYHKKYVEQSFFNKIMGSVF